MKNFPFVGPSVVVVVAGGVALVASPMIVRRSHDAQASAQIAQASLVLAQDALPDDETSPSATPRDGETSAPTARTPNRAPVHEPILEQINRANRAIAKLVEPSVVHVSAQNEQRRGNYIAPFASSGSGWIWDEAGHIVTNAHVIEGANRLQVQFFDGELRDAELVGLDLRTDIAVIKVSSEGIHPSLRGDSAFVEQGDMVYAFGSPFDFRFSMSAGIVSGLGRSTALDNIDYQNFIQTDAAINPGNSGGPLTDVRGRVIGMNTAIATNPGSTAGQAQFAGIGLAIPMSMIESTVTQLIETGEVRKGYLGVEVLSLDQVRFGRTPYRSVLDHFKGEGAMLGRVTEGSPAEAAGFHPGDIILSIDGQKVGSDRAVRAIVSSRSPGDAVRFELWRIAEDAPSASTEPSATSNTASEGQRLELTATLAQLDVSANLAPTLPGALATAGATEFVTATADRAKALGVPFRRGVLIEQVTQGSDLASAVPPGSAITAIFNQPIGSVDEMYTRFARALDGMSMRRMRNGGPSMVEVPLTITVPDGRMLQILVPCPLRLPNG